MLMLSLLVLQGCAHRLPAIVDTYCTDYTPVIQKPGDEKAIKPAGSVVKKRILGNELKYEDRCEKKAGM